MKKILLSIMLLMLINVAYAQHLKFEGIPIDGSITSFQNQLTAKGIKVNGAKSKDAPIGQRIFNGKLYGHNSEIIVYYARKSKIVYKVKVEINSEKKDVIQSILDKSLNKIEKSYNYTTEHDVDDATDLQFRYYIYPTRNSGNSIGTIEVHPTHSYYLTGNENNPLGFSGFTICFAYVDKQNDTIVPPSEKEPHSSPSFTCGKTDNFRKFSEWMLGYVQNGCYERAIDYADWLLDYYRYDCIPNYVKNADDGDKQFDEIIKVMQEQCIGSIHTGIGRERTKVYMVTDNETGTKFIEFDAKFYKGLLWNHIKFNEYDISQLIKTLEQLMTSFRVKEKQISIQPSDKDWEEKLIVNIPAFVGKEKAGTYGNIQWNKTNLLAYYSYREEKMSLKITYEDEFQFVFRFYNSDQIESLMQFFKSIEWE